jgi:hypothetical protein
MLKTRRWSSGVTCVPGEHSGRGLRRDGRTKTPELQPVVLSTEPYEDVRDGDDNIVMVP